MRIGCENVSRILLYDIVCIFSHPTHLWMGSSEQELCLPHKAKLPLGVFGQCRHDCAFSSRAHRCTGCENIHTIPYNKGYTFCVWCQKVSRDFLTPYTYHYTYDTTRHPTISVRKSCCRVSSHVTHEWVVSRDFEVSRECLPYIRVDFLSLTYTHDTLE